MFFLLLSTDEDAAQGAVDLLTTNATNLRSVVEGVLNAADSAIIRVPKSEKEKLAIKGRQMLLDACLEIIDLTIAIDSSPL